MTPPRVCRAKTGRGPAGRGTAAAPGPAPPTESDGGGTKGPASGKCWSPWALPALTPPDTKAPSVGGGVGGACSRARSPVPGIQAGEADLGGGSVSVNARGRG